MKNYSYEEKIQKAEQERNQAEQAALERGDSEAFSITAGIRAYEKAVKEYTLKHIGKVDLNECQPSDLLTFIEDINKNVSVPHFTGTDTNKETLRLVNDGIQKVAAYLQNKKASGYGVEEIKALKTIVKIAGQIHENSGVRRELIESYYEEYQRELERFLESDPETFSLEAEIHHYIEILEPVLRGDGQEMWQALDRIISAKNSMEGIVAKEMYIRGFLDYERLVCEKDNHI